MMKSAQADESRSDPIASGTEASLPSGETQGLSKVYYEFWKLPDEFVKAAREWYWSPSLPSLVAICIYRERKDAQDEIR